MGEWWPREGKVLSPPGPQWGLGSRVEWMEPVEPRWWMWSSLVDAAWGGLPSSILCLHPLASFPGQWVKLGHPRRAEIGGADATGSGLDRLPGQQCDVARIQGCTLGM